MRENEFKAVWFSPIENDDQCLAIIRNVSILYLIYALLLGFSYFFTGPGAILQGMVFAVLAYALRKYRSLFAAAGLLVATMVFLIIGILHISEIINLFRTNIILLTILVWASYRGLAAVSRLSPEHQVQ